MIPELILLIAFLNPCAPISTSVPVSQPTPQVEIKVPEVKFQIPESLKQKIQRDLYAARAIGQSA